MAHPEQSGGPREELSVERKAAVVVDIIRGQTTSSEVAREHAVAADDVEAWVGTFVSAGKDALRNELRGEFFPRIAVLRFTESTSSWPLDPDPLHVNAHIVREELALGMLPGVRVSLAPDCDCDRGAEILERLASLLRTHKRDLVAEVSAANERLRRQPEDDVDISFPVFPKLWTPSMQAAHVAARNALCREMWPKVQEGQIRCEQCDTNVFRLSKSPGEESLII